MSRSEPITVKFEQSSTAAKPKAVILSRLRRGGAEAFLSRAVGAVLLFLMHTVLARLNGSEGYGIICHTLALGGLLAVLTPFGIPTAVTRFAAQYVRQKRWDLLKGVLIRSHQMILLTSGLASIVLVLLSYWNNVSTELATSLRFAAFLLPFLALAGLRRRAFQGFHKPKESIIPDEIGLPILVVSGVIIGGIHTASDSLYIYTSSVVTIFCLGSYWLWRSIPQQVRLTEAKFQTQYWVSVAIPMVFGPINQLVMNRIAILMLGSFADMEAVALFSAASRIAVLNTFVLASINTIAAPMLSAAHHSNDRQEFWIIMRHAMMWSTFGSLPLFVIIIAWPQTLLAIFGPTFTKAGLVLRILAVGRFINAMTGPVGFALLMAGEERRFALLVGAVALVDIIGNYFLIQWWGVIGAAIVTAICIITLNVSMLLVTSAIFRRDPQ